jgi:hypothetical protein
MKHILVVLLAFIAFGVHANSVWIEQNKLVGEIGGWRTYAKEKSSQKSTSSEPRLTLGLAIERSLRNHLDTMNYLPGSESIDHFYLLSPAQRSALQQRYAIIYETTKAYYELVALHEKLIYMEDVLDAVEAATELSNRMLKVGNVNQLTQLKQNQDLQKKRLQYLALQTKYVEAKERFIQRMNYDSRDTRRDVEERLPDPPKEPRTLSSKEQSAMGLGNLSNPSSIQTRSNARMAYERYLEKYQRAKVFKEIILPNQKKISEEKLLRYNAMLIDVFHLLEDAEDQGKTVMDYIDANAAQLIESARLDKALIDAQMDFSNINAR